MKRKIFSKLLMVALVIAAVGSFVSCKDYDDDINNLQKQIDAKAAISELTALQSTLDSKIAAAKSAADAAQAKADAAATKTSVDELKKALETAIADAKKAGTDAGTKAGEAITAANKAQETADAAAAAAKKADEDAKAALADALKTIEETYQTKAEAAAAAAEAAEALAAVKETADAAFTKAEAEKLQEQVDGLKAELEAAIDEKIDAKIKEVNNAVASVDAIWAAVTGIELFGTYTGLPGRINWNAITGGIGTKTLAFLTGEIAKSSVFGNDEDAAGQKATETVTYTKGDSVKISNVIVVKVNPVNATLAAKDVKLIDSEGNDLSDYVDVTDVKEFKTLITRGTVQTGLWQISVALKKGIKNNDFNNNSMTDFDVRYVERNPNVVSPAWGVFTYKLYAVAVNNTAEAAAGRYVTTTFDIDAYANDYYPEFSFDFTVNNKGIDEIKNRWDGVQVMAEDNTVSVKNPELEWPDYNPWTATSNYAKAIAAGLEIPATELQKSGAVTNYQTAVAKATSDNEVRWGKDLLPVKTNVAFTLSGFDYTKIDRYYVVLDELNAIESAPSEIRAWHTYTYEGLNTMTPATEDLKIKITSEKASHDIIGFRVYAVNYDGTLADPDGRAFYVLVDGNAPASEGSVASTVAWTANTAVGSVTAKPAKNSKVNASAIYDLVLPEDGFETLPVSGYQQVKVEQFVNDEVLVNDIDLWYNLLDANSNPVADWKDAKKIKIAIDNPMDWLDNAETSVTIEGKSGEKVVNSIVLNVKKVMPDGDDTGISIKAGADFRNNTDLYVYMTPLTAFDATKDIIDYAAPTIADMATPVAAGTQAAFGGYTLANDLVIPQLGSATSTYNVVLKGATFRNLGDGYDVAWNNVRNDADYTIPGSDADLFFAVPASDLRLKADNTGYQNARWNNKVNGTAKEAVVNKVYANVSAKYVYGALIQGDYTAAAKTFNIHFCDIQASTTAKILNYQYVSSFKANSDASKYLAQWTNSNAFGMDYTAGGTAFTFGPLNKSIALPATIAEAKTMTNNVYVKDFDANYATNAIAGKVFYAQDELGLFGVAPNANDGSQIVDRNSVTTYASAPNNQTVLINFATYMTQANTVYPSTLNGIFDGTKYIPMSIQPKNTKAINQSAALPLTGADVARVKAVLSGGAADYYFVWSLTAGTYVALSQYNDNPATITVPVTGKITLSGYTQFGNNVTIGEIPFSVKANN